MTNYPGRVMWRGWGGGGDETMTNLPIISREATEQYEAVRAAGNWNMLDVTSVRGEARDNDYHALAELTDEHYYALLFNYDFYMATHGVKRIAQEPQP